MCSVRIEVTGIMDATHNDMRNTVERLLHLQAARLEQHDVDIRGFQERCHFGIASGCSPL
eukprot:2253615-Pyramimonas_sp.AAC.1